MANHTCYGIGCYNFAEHECSLCEGLYCDDHIFILDKDHVLGHGYLIPDIGKEVQWPTCVDCYMDEALEVSIIKNSEYTQACLLLPCKLCYFNPADDLFTMHDSLLADYFWEDAFRIAVGVYPSFFDLWIDIYVKQIPQTSRSLDDLFETFQNEHWYKDRVKEPVALLPQTCETLDYQFEILLRDYYQKEG